VTGLARCGLLLLLVKALGCTPARAPEAGSVVLRGTDGSLHPVDAELRGHPLTVVSFFSAHCPCQRAHDARIRELVAKDAPLGVGFLFVDSEESATMGRDADEARARGYALVLDDGGKLARALDAEYATFSVVLDRDGHVVYRGGFDSDQHHLRDDRAPYLANAIDDLLAGRAPRASETKALGCTLELR